MTTMTNSPSQIHRAKHDSFNMTGSQPIPSQCSRDPLNWSSTKRVFIFISVGVYSWTSTVVVQAASLMLNGLSKDFAAQISYPWTVMRLASTPVLFIGLGAIIWVPLTLALGRRPVFLLATTTLMLSTVGAGCSRTYWELLFCVSFFGLAQGFGLSAGFLIFIDISFMHQRPAKIAMVWSVIGGLANATMSTIPFITGDGINWRRAYYFWSIPAGISCIMAFALFPETYFLRGLGGNEELSYDGLIIIQTTTERFIIYEQDERDADAKANWQTHNKTLPTVPSRSRLQHLCDRLGSFRASKTSWKAMLACYPQMLLCFINPLIFWSVIMNTVNFVGMMFISSTYAIILSFPPYSLSSSLLIQRLSRRNKGVREAEHYLVGYILPVLAGSLSTLIYGLAVSRYWHFGFYYLAYGLNGFGFIALAITNTLWVTEAFPRWAAAALMCLVGIAMILSFSISFVIEEWIVQQRFFLVGAELTVLQFVTGLVCMPIASYGKSLRQKINGRRAGRREGGLRPL
ncbi:MFS general substrate transporter [Polyplosphaeria fusca]|uniref:MFS general substrate transporter n=1 Tax=Polyplosphaeria fusca TaxID=682080 RepID=A0A9P4UV92_9PLEO|nr:MFS general substrate transporter [Polyplosphaeria fusca]